MAPAAISLFAATAGTKDLRPLISSFVPFLETRSFRAVSFLSAARSSRVEAGASSTV
jgi:hypothetical protein